MEYYLIIKAIYMITVNTTADATLTYQELIDYFVLPMGASYCIVSMNSSLRQFIQNRSAKLDLGTKEY